MAVGAGSTSDPPVKNRPGGGAGRPVLDAGAQGIMSGRAGDLSPQQQEALTRVRSLGGGRLGQGPSSPGAQPRKGTRRLQRTGCPGSWAPTWARSPPLWAFLRLSPALHLCRRLATEPCPLREVEEGGWVFKGPRDEQKYYLENKFSVLPLIFLPFFFFSFLPVFGV